MLTGSTCFQSMSPSAPDAINPWSQVTSRIPERFALSALARLQGTNLRVREGHLSNPTTRALHPTTDW